VCQHLVAPHRHTQCHLEVCLSCLSGSLYLVSYALAALSTEVHVILCSHTNICSKMTNTHSSSFTWNTMAENAIRAGSPTAPLIKPESQYEAHHFRLTWQLKALRFHLSYFNGGGNSW
jgi:hypothetical protein